MPHISSKPLRAKDLEYLDERLFVAFANTNTRNRKQLYGELLTKTERIMLAKRLEMLYLINKGVSTFKISKALNVSPSTVARFELAVSRGAYRDTSNWLGKQRFSSQILQLFFELASVPFEVQKRRGSALRYKK